MISPAFSKDISAIDPIVGDTLDLHGHPLPMRGSLSTTFLHFGRDCSGTVVLERPQTEAGPPAWLIRMLANPQVARPLKRAELRWARRANGEVVLY